MNRVKFTTLILMMLLSIIGIIWVQTVWIRDAVSIQNEVFDNRVAISLNDARNAIEFSRRMSFLNDFMIDEPIQYQDSASSEGDGLMIQSFSSFSGMNDSGMVVTRNRSYFFNGDTSIVSDTAYSTIPGRSGMMQLPPEQGGIQGSFPGQNDFMNKMRRKANAIQNLSSQMISDVYQWEKTLDFNPREVTTVLQRTLSYNLHTPYEFAIIRNGDVQGGTFSKSDNGDFLKSRYKVGLFPDNILNQDIVLSVVFPEKTNFVLRSIGWLLGGSMLFSLFILATFALSLYFIITQKKVSEMKSDFLNNMTHEFKTPIATISLAADTITNPKVIRDENSVRHFVGMIKKENSRMNKKVETILQIASLDKKEIEFRFENVNLHTIIQHAIETIDIQVQQKNGRIIQHLNADEPVICGDSDHLTNLVNNFLDNALKYSPDDPEITVSTKNVGKGLVLTVEDKGIGMSKAVQSKIFERFYRQASGNVHDVKGFGLGLNYARAIIEAHKGNVTVTSEPGKGSKFDIYLPFNCD
jgi:two-component system phosphate regulon sensor histidine kinase PhoR